MNKQIVAFSFGDTVIYSNNFTVIQSPGVGSILFKTLSDGIWTGYVHLYPSRWNDEVNLSAGIGSITKIATRSSMDEDDEPWNVLFKREIRPFSYEYEAQLELLIKNISTLDRINQL